MFKNIRNLLLKTLLIRGASEEEVDTIDKIFTKYKIS